MKGLLFREFWLGRKYYSLSLIMFLLTAVISILVRLSMLYGNLAHVSEDTLFRIDRNASEIMTFLPCIVIFISFCVDGGVIFSDYSTSWFKYCSTTPLIEKKIIKIKFLSKGISMLTAFVLSLVYIAVICGVSGNAFTFDTFKSLIFLLTLGIAVSVLYLTLSVKFKDKNTVTIILFGIFTVLCIPVTAYTVRLNTMNIGTSASVTDDESSDYIREMAIQKLGEIRDIVFPMSPIIILAAVAVGYVLSVRFLKRREN